MPKLPSRGVDVQIQVCLTANLMLLRHMSLNFNFIKTDILKKEVNTQIVNITENSIGFLTFIQD